MLTVLGKGLAGPFLLGKYKDVWDPNSTLELVYWFTGNLLSPSFLWDTKQSVGSKVFTHDI